MWTAIAIGRLHASKRRRRGPDQAETYYQHACQPTQHPFELRNSIAFTMGHTGRPARRVSHFPATSQLTRSQARRPMPGKHGGRRTAGRRDALTADEGRTSRWRRIASASGTASNRCLRQGFRRRGFGHRARCGEPRPHRLARPARPAAAFSSSRFQTRGWRSRWTNALLPRDSRGTVAESNGDVIVQSGHASRDLRLDADA